jgi:hypothetical protein
MQTLVQKSAGLRGAGKQQNINISINVLSCDAHRGLFCSLSHRSLLVWCPYSLILTSQCVGRVRGCLAISCSFQASSTCCCSYQQA